MHLAIGQAPVVLGDIAKNLETMETLIKDSKKKHDKKIDLIVFPELFITGYNLRDNYSKIAEQIPSNDVAQKGINELAKKYDILIVSGLYSSLYFQFLYHYLNSF